MSTNGAGPTCLHFNCGRNGPSLIVLYIYFDARSLKRSAEVKYFRLRLQPYGLPGNFNLRDNESNAFFGYKETIASLRVATGDLGFGPKW
jgi:hypothetical protein